MHEIVLERRRQRHQRIPSEYHMARGRQRIWGPMLTVAVSREIVDRLKAVCAMPPPYEPQRRLSEIARWAFALGRSVLIAREDWGGTAPAIARPSTVIGLPECWALAWPSGMTWTPGAACRAALEVGLGLLERQVECAGMLKMPNERMVRIFQTAPELEREIERPVWEQPRPDRGL